MAFSPSTNASSATLANPTSTTSHSHSQTVVGESKYDYPYTDGTRTPASMPTTPSYMYHDSKTAYSGGDDGLSQAGSSITTGVARDSTYLLPTTDRKKNRYIPVVLRLLIAVGVPISLVLLAIALEVGIFFSQKNEWCVTVKIANNNDSFLLPGFHVPTQNALSFASAQFLLSIIPTLFVVFPAWLYRELDWHIRWYQPYVVMSRGNARAEESVLLDYVSLGPIFSIINSAKFKHRVITWSTLTALASYILQPLAGSMFQLRNLNQAQPTTITSTRIIDVADFSNLTAFTSSAGFVEASVFTDLPDPSFIQKGWATAQFEFPGGSYLNASLALNTSGIQSNPTCSVPNGTLSVTSNDGVFTISSTSSAGCALSVTTLNASISALQYGVVPVPESCSSVNNVTQSPVMFWFLNVATDGTPQASTIFCKPTIEAFNVLATTNLNNNSVSVQLLNSDVAPNSVTNGPYSNAPLNGVIFENYTDTLLQAKANAVNNAVPGAIFQLAAQSGGLDAAFSAPNPFLDNTTYVYQMYLALLAKSVYFVPQNTVLQAQITSITLRLTINPLPGHGLAFFLFFIGFTGAIVHIISHRQRKGLYLSTAPGTIAATIGMTSHSGFGELLMPYDDEATLQRKLSDLRFSIDRRTGAIVATPASSSRESKRMSKKTARDEAMESLLGGDRKRTPSEMGMAELGLSESSSQAAFEAASAQPGYPPMRSP
ncbi:hypothetical protein BT96DRAFT_1016815 [Gymnopus androsaceus JB14]|uniref:Uncharacterized protein n=1 Tax=Gymnopus androsaceus JB14 TaxID=1447944 RepID=A0A6A4I0D3_9AGAR|nr:hypothetical protein BT96DRAFT_1016815 [Gymnopus androsaceus JB14]